jgi:hypothetical protein
MAAQEVCLLWEYSQMPLRCMSGNRQREDSMASTLLPSLLNMRTLEV